MESFLKLTANDLWQRTAGDMTSVTIVFPNKRAALFFNEHLARQTDRPTWTPSYMTISELFRSLTQLKTGDPIKLVSDLYKVYTSVTGSNESLDSFYFWGEILISDFDDADKNLVDTSVLFRNLKDLGELSADYSFLGEEQREAIRQFFHGYNAGGDTELKSKFSALWNSLGEIYEGFKSLLLKQEIAYEGMIYRQAIENLSPESMPSKIYAFVGFNVLNKVEQRLFSLLEKAGKALFYWDYDVFYLKRSPHEAGEFMRRNLRNFPSPLPESLFDSLSTPKDIAFIESPTDTGQAAYVSDWIASHLTKDDERQTAVVLCDEQLLLPVLHSIPDIVRDINITMGYPLSQTRACSLAIDMLDNNTGDDNLQLCQEICNAVKDLAQSDHHTSGLDTESCFRTYTIFTRLSTLIQSGDLTVETHTLRRLAKRILSAATVPFHGEPARGLQVMGVLETRNLDFRNVLMLSVNEGKLPKGENSASFIPYSLRKAFGMTTVDHKVAVYAYYFYRLIQRCEHVTMIYTTVTEGSNRSEMSRFILQLMTELPYNVGANPCGSPALFTFNCSLLTSKDSSVAKTEEMLCRLRTRYDITLNSKASLSPKALNTYLTCRMKFFFNYVAGLKPFEKRDNTIDAARFGTIFHKAAELAYRDLRQSGNLITKEALTGMIKDNAKMQDYTDQAFREQYDTMNGSHLIAEKVIVSYLKRLLIIDAEYAPFTFLSSEHWASREFSCPEIKTRVGGIIDRIDGKDNTVRIVDYKTGGKPSTVPNIESLFTRNGEHDGYAFQTFLYSSILCDKYPDKKIAPAILYIHKAAADDYSPAIIMGQQRDKQPVTDFHLLNDEFRHHLTELISEIISPNTSFDRTDNEDSCRYCDFRYLCKS